MLHMKPGSMINDKLKTVLLSIIILLKILTNGEIITYTNDSNLNINYYNSHQMVLNNVIDPYN